jgi:hypothetical protein
MHHLVKRISYIALVMTLGVSTFPAHAVPTDIILFQENLDGTITQFFNGASFGTCAVESAGCSTTSEQGGGTGIPTFGSSAFPINVNIYDDAAKTALSDTFSLSVQDFSGVGGTANTVVATFISEAVGALSGGTVISLVETGIIQDLGTMTFVDLNGAPIDAIQYEFVSNELATPLPAALPLFATGLGALGLLGWRRKRKATALAA